MEEVNNRDGEPRTIIIRQEVRKSNGIGVAGFVLAIVAIVLGWIPVLGFVLWFLGLVFSFAGLFRSPRGFAVAGFVVSLIGIVLLLVVFAGVAGLALLAA